MEVREGTKTREEIEIKEKVEMKRRRGRVNRPVRLPRRTSFLHETEVTIGQNGREQQGTYNLGCAMRKNNWRHFEIRITMIDLSNGLQPSC
eukprot:763721-Hanusia_phi.AAC.3